MPRLYPFSQFGKYGFIDASGRVVVEPSLSSARAVRHGLAAACVGKEWGYIDLNGRWAIAPRFDDAQSFAGARAVAERRGKKGLIDREGSWVIEPIWDGIRSDGDLWRVQEGDLTGWLGPDGQTLVPPRWADVSGSMREAILVKDAEGSAVLEPTTGALRRLVADETRWPGIDTIPARKGALWGWLDHDGNWVLPPAWGYVDVFLGDRAVVRKEIGQFGLIDRTGRRILAPEYATIRPAGGGWMVEATNGSISHVDDEGRPLSGPWKSHRCVGVDGVILVEAESGWGAIDPHGWLLLEPTHEELEDGGEGLLAVLRAGRWGYVDPHAPSPFLIEPRFKSFATFDGELASIDEGRAYIDKTGSEVWRRPPPRTPALHRRDLRSPDWKAVRDRLAGLAKEPGASVFGAREPGSGHGFALGPTMSEAALSALEQEHRLELPIELRSFLLQVGNGPGLEGVEGGAGPGYGLYEIEAVLDAAPRAHEPFVPPCSSAEWLAASERDEEAVPPGLIVVGTHGCAFDFGLVVTGPYAGTMWTYVDPGWIPDAIAWTEVLAAHHGNHATAHEWCWQHLGELQIATFADAYMRWLDSALAAEPA